MRKMLTALVAAIALAGALSIAAPSARAENGQITAGVIGGLAAGALIGGAIASQAAPPPAYYAPAPVYVAPRCRWVNQEMWDPYYRAYVVRPVKICG